MTRNLTESLPTGGCTSRAADIAGALAAVAAARRCAWPTAASDEQDPQNSDDANGNRLHDRLTSARNGRDDVAQDVDDQVGLDVAQNQAASDDAVFEFGRQIRAACAAAAAETSPAESSSDRWC